MTAILAELNILTLDCQATGANPAKGHLLEIGWCPTRASAGDNPAATGLKNYLIRLPADAAIPRVVQRITGISDDSITDAISLEIVWEHLIETATQITAGSASAACPTVIHFARFEEPFLHELHKKNNAAEPFPFRIICTHEIAVRLLPELPRKGIRAIAGYFGHSMPEFKRSADHVIATAFIWKKMVALLSTTCGISRLDQLAGWLDATKPAGRSKRTFPMNPEIHRRLPDKPGVYRMLRVKKGDPLYIGKAKSLRQRVNSYFRQKAPLAEHTLEMLTQARELDFTLTGSALEAAVLESDEIKRHSPPYNIALRRRQRGLAFCSKDLCRHSAVVDSDCPVGPLPAGRFINSVSAFGLWLSYGMQVNDDDQLDIAYSILALPPEYASEGDCMRAGAKIFRENYGSRPGQQSALRLLTARGAQLWRERREAAALTDTVAEKETANGNVDTEQKEPGQEHIWTPEAVARSIEKMVLHSAQLIRRARWFCLLSESSLAWSTADLRNNFKILVVFENGAVRKRDEIKTGKIAPIPPGCAKSFRTRQKNIDLITYDRLRVVTTELRRLVSEGRDIEMRLGPKVTLNRREVMRALQWV